MDGFAIGGNGARRRAPSFGRVALGWAVAGWIVAAGVPLTAVPALGSSLLAPAVGTADGATQGTRVADPHTPASALFANPAGLVQFDTFTSSSDLGIGFGQGRIEASAPPTYDEANNMWTIVPDFGLSIPYGGRWRFAIGSYGSTGSTFDYDDDPAAGVPDFFSETIVLAFPLGVAYRLTDQIAVGAGVETLYGQLRTHFTQEDLFFRYKINGVGVQGMVGLAVHPVESWGVGLSVRVPGMIWMDGSMPVPGAGRQDVSVDLLMPTQVFLGATWHCTHRLTVSGSIRFTDASTLGDSTIEYELTPQANIGFIPEAKDEWRFALAGEYALREQLMVRVGASWASSIVGTAGMSPLAWDGNDAKISVGLGRRYDHWAFDAMAGYLLPTERRVTSAEALVLPGKYSLQGGIFQLGVTYRY